MRNVSWLLISKTICASWDLVMQTIQTIWALVVVVEDLEETGMGLMRGKCQASISIMKKKTN